MIKENIKMRVTPEQLKKIQEICNSHTILLDLYVETPSYIYLTKEGLFGDCSEVNFKLSYFEEISFNYFIDNYKRLLPKPNNKVKMLTEDIMEVKSESNEILTIELKIIGAIRKMSDGSTELNFKGNKRMILNLSNETYKTFKDIWVQYTDKRNKELKER